MSNAAQIALMQPLAATSLADWLTAVGTVAASVLALFGIYRAAWSRPRLRMEIDLSPAPNADLQEVSSTSSGDPLMTAWIRARVISKRGLAVRAKVMILRAVVKDSSQTRKTLKVDGWSLAWSQQNPPTAQLDIPPGLSRRVDIASVTKIPVGTPLLQIETFTHTSESVFGGELTLDLAVASSNGPASYYRAVLQYDGHWPNPAPGIWATLRVVSLKRQQRLRSLVRA